VRGIVNKLLSSVYNPTDASPNFGHDQTWVAERREEFFLHSRPTKLDGGPFEFCSAPTHFW